MTEIYDMPHNIGYFDVSGTPTLRLNTLQGVKLTGETEAFRTETRDIVCARPKYPLKSIRNDPRPDSTGRHTCAISEIHCTDIEGCPDSQRESSADGFQIVDRSQTVIAVTSAGFPYFRETTYAEKDIILSCCDTLKCAVGCAGCERYERPSNRFGICNSESDDDCLSFGLPIFDLVLNTRHPVGAMGEAGAIHAETDRVEDTTLRCFLQNICNRVPIDAGFHTGITADICDLSFRGRPVSRRDGSAGLSNLGTAGMPAVFPYFRGVGYVRRNIIISRSDILGCAVSYADCIENNEARGFQFLRFSTPKNTHGLSPLSSASLYLKTQSSTPCAIDANSLDLTFFSRYSMISGDNVTVSDFFFILSIQGTFLSNIIYTCINDSYSTRIIRVGVLEYEEIKADSESYGSRHQKARTDKENDKLGMQRPAFGHRPRGCVHHTHALGETEERYHLQPGQVDARILRSAVAVGEAGGVRMNPDYCRSVKCPNYVTGGGCEEAHCLVFFVDGCTMMKEVSE